MMDPPPTPTPMPVTPARRKDRSDVVAAFERFWLDFFPRYGLAWPLPAKDSSPSKPKGETGDVVAIYYNLRFICLQDNKTKNDEDKTTTSLDAIRFRFHEGARQLCKKWVTKPGDRDVTPPLRGQPRATNPAEQRSLRDLLKEIVADYLPEGGAAGVESDHLFSPPKLPTPTSQNVSPRSKRLSGDVQESPSQKRAKSMASSSSSLGNHGRPATPVHRRDSDVFSSKKLSSALETPPGFFAAPSLGRERTYASSSANTSHLTLLSKVFDDDDEQAPPASQDTQITTDTTKERTSPSSQDSYPVSSADIRAFYESLGQQESEAALPNHRIVPVESGSPVSSDDASLLAEQLAAEQLAADLERQAADRDVPAIEKRLRITWPLLPFTLDHAPFPIRWEISRVAWHCGIEVEDLALQYDDDWTNYDKLWKMLRHHPMLRDKTFPDACSMKAWKESLDSFGGTDHVLTLSAKLEWSRKTQGSLFRLKLHPFRSELPHRFDRRFGSRRFLEIQVPSMTSHDAPNEIKDLGEAAASHASRWFACDSHHFLGRKWGCFFLRQLEPERRKKHRDDQFGPEPPATIHHRLYFFAEDGPEFFPDSTYGRAMSRDELIEWLLQPSRNLAARKDQIVPKFFSRIALGLSRSRPTVLLTKDEIIHCDQNLLSEDGKIMNDGIGRMSTSLARRIRDKMGLADIPAGFQGRIGSAKGFWIRDVEGRRSGDWIELYPSQTKWICDFDHDEHRVFEVKSAAKELRPSNLNLQFLPILEDRAHDAGAMRRRLGHILTENLFSELEAQKVAVQGPLQFRAWAHKNSAWRQKDRLKIQNVPFLGGLPRSQEDQMTVLLDAGFHPVKQKFLQEIVWRMTQEKCDELKTRLNITVGCSTFAYMVVDFLGVLQEDEIHLGFSSKFPSEQFSETHLHGMDVLVARSPSHFVSDIQKVKAVFKPELGSLKDVVIFPTRGRMSLAEKLSGGDYDGDMAFICWDPDIVDNFHNAEMPSPLPNLAQEGFFSAETETYGDLVAAHGAERVISTFVQKALVFSMQPSFLGIATNFKENLCYQRRSVSDDVAVLLSTLVGGLVDQAKQGINFKWQDWYRLRRRVHGGSEPPRPQYKNSDQTELHDDSGGQSIHIIDHLKFQVAIPAIDRELRSLHEWFRNSSEAHFWDRDLGRWYERWAARAKVSRDVGRVLTALRQDLDGLYKDWGRMTCRDDLSWEMKITSLYEKWQSIQPACNEHSDLHFALDDGVRAEFTMWSLVKASVCFKLYYNRSAKFVWWIAGRQLQWLKAWCAQPTSTLTLANANASTAVAVTSEMYAGLIPDKKYARAVAAAHADSSLLESMEAGEEDEELPPEDDA